ncbi:probable DIP5 - glutamate and aspartate permease [Cephalotrichum gorgonifer]|uniref:Probable DIP5 - glutamate and aspartate permease n=1 Tax=Cephalotrichum gorgonifer TaxID=2041049 RepID=A0AAE8SUL1_9PEZI|nr:probable DIP5 - glutamate and aspartate permease [Cephalotrichum gorgonifer]
MNDGISRRKPSSIEEDPEKSGFDSKHDEKFAGPDTMLDQSSTEVTGHGADVTTSLHRGLQARHITMIAMGGALGTGLVIGTGKALAQAGPASVFIAYLIMGFVVFLVMAGLGEMAAWLPIASGFTGYASRFVDPSLGFSLGWLYWFKYIILTPNQLTAGAMVVQFWVPRETLNPGVFIAIFLVLIVCINYFGIKFFGEFEFWLSSFKVIVVIGLIIFSLCLALGGGPDHDRKGFRYWQEPGAFRAHIKEGSAGKFLGFWSCLINATFAYLGTELVGVTVAEAQNPRRVVPRAIKLTLYRIIVFYCLSCLLIGMNVPYDSEKLAFATGASTSAAASPFVVAAEIAGVKAMSHIINACILMFVFSASNSDLYIASRTLYGLAADGKAPAIFKRTDSRGVPIYALGMSAAIALLAFMNVSDDSTAIFGYFVNMVTIFGLMSWISLLVTHIAWCRARKVQGLADEALPYVAPLGIYGSYAALFICILVALTKNYQVFVGGDFGKTKYKDFITGYLGIPLFLIFIFGHKIIYKTKRIKPEELDFYTGKDAIDREEEEFLAQKAARLAEKGGPTRGGWFYRTFLQWLF